jgi:hypothetical protein
MQIKLNIDELNMLSLGLSRYQTQVAIDIAIGDDLWETKDAKEERLLKISRLMSKLDDLYPKIQEA